jgi:hypothetical protein
MKYFFLIIHTNFAVVPQQRISAESTSRQKSFRSSVPSNRIRNRGPSLSIIVPIDHESWFLGSIDSSFSPILNSFFGGFKDLKRKWFTINNQ